MKHAHDIDDIGVNTHTVSPYFILQHRSVITNTIVRKKLMKLGSQKNQSLTANASKERSIDILSNNIEKQINDGLKRGGLDKRKLLLPYFNRAMAYERVKKLTKAMHDYTECIRIDKTFAEAYFKRAELHQINNDIEKAIDDLKNAVKYDVTNIAYRTNLAIMLRKHGQYFDAITETIICRAVDLNPELVDELRKPHFDESRLMNLDAKLLKHLKKGDDPVAMAMSIPKAKRTTADLEKIVMFLVTMKFFAPFARQTDLLMSIAASLELVLYRRDEIVFEQGRQGSSFFMILDGEITIVRDEIIGDVIFKRPMVKLFRSQTFGDLALNHDGGVRTAGAIATTHTRLLKLHRDDYQQITVVYRANLYEEVKIMLRSNDIFKRWPDDKLTELARNVQEQMYSPNTEILKAGEPTKFFYIIRLGMVKLMKRAKRPKLNFVKKHVHHHKPHAPTSGNDAENNKNPEFEMGEPSGSTFDDFSLADDDSLVDASEFGLWSVEKNWRDKMLSYDVAESDRMHLSEEVRRSSLSLMSNGEFVDYTVAVLGTGQVFGEMGILDNIIPSPVSATSFTAVEVYAFDINIFSRLEARFMPECMKPVTELANLHNPPPEKLSFFLKQKMKWELKKRRVLKDIRERSNH